MAFASSGTEPAQRCREIKIVLLGDSGVGKSSIAQRYVTSRRFISDFFAILGANVITKYMPSFEVFGVFKMNRVFRKVFLVFSSFAVNDLRPEQH